MQSLADLQSGIARAVTLGEAPPNPDVFVGGGDPGKRLGVHRRHYAASLAAALQQKFPASAWLAGTDLVAAAARAYVRTHPPRKPCIVEYGADFAAFLAGYDRAPTLPYLRSFAELEWAVAQVSIAIDLPPLRWPALARVGTHALLDSRVTLQPGTRYVRASWGVDELMRMYLGNAEIETFFLPEAETFIEVRGARGELRVARIAAAAFAFRASLSAGKSIGDAADAALECDATFDAGGALRGLVECDLVATLCTSDDGSEV
jgi:hypothetical protein